MDSIPWVRCAFGNVLIQNSELPVIARSFFKIWIVNHEIVKELLSLQIWIVKLFGNFSGWQWIAHKLEFAVGPDLAEA